MFRFFLHRPVAVGMSFLAIAILGVLAYLNLPVSLMPDASVPRLRVEVAYPEGSPLYIEQSILRPLRSAFQGLYQIERIESISASGTGQLELSFSFGTNMRLAYIEVNEKMDQAMSSLPREVDRPVVKRSESTDIPLARLQLTSETYSRQELSDLGRFVVRRRLEQIEGVSLVEMNGGEKRVFRIIPNTVTMATLGISLDKMIQSLVAANTTLNQIKVREGIYEFDITFDNLLADPENLKRVQVYSQSGDAVPLESVADLAVSVARPGGIHLYNGSRGIVFAIHKQTQANYTSLDRQLMNICNELQADYPLARFTYTQSQSGLLRDSIRQLVLSLVLGTVLSFLILFLFSGEWKSPVLMGVLIPVSMLATLCCLYLVGLSINIISLSGMLLGIGILIDNGIIIIDNIQVQQKKGILLDQACASGTLEVIPALISSTLTTLSVFIPLVFMQGMAGTLFKEQAYTLSVVMIGSLLVSFFLLPVLYRRFQPRIDRSENTLFARLLVYYKKSQEIKYNSVYGLFFLVLLAGGVLSYMHLPAQNLPDIRTHDASVRIVWDEPLSLQENESRTRALVENMHQLLDWEADIGQNEIVENGINTRQQSLVYLKFEDEKAKERGLLFLKDKFRRDYPATRVTIQRAKNPYDQLFVQNEPFVSYRLRTSTDQLIDVHDLASYLPDDVTVGDGFQLQSGLNLVFDPVRLSTYGLTEDQIIRQLKIQFNDQLVTTVNEVNESVPVVVRGTEKIIQPELTKLFVTAGDSVNYPVTYFFEFQESVTPRFITADKAGVFQEVRLEDSNPRLAAISESIVNLAKSRGWTVSQQGSFLYARQNLLNLLVSFVLAIVLLYVILAAQFESLLLPVIILSEIPISASGSLLFLYATGHTLNISSLIGLVIMLGIIVNDSILKVDTINRYRKNGVPTEAAIQIGGADRLKPILMTSLTTILALVPVLFSKGLGGDLQAPLAIAVIGGLAIGTVCSIYLVPILYRKFMA